MAGLRNFGITFLLSLIIFGVAGYFLTGFVEANMIAIIDQPITDSTEPLTDEQGNTIAPMTGEDGEPITGTTQEPAEELKGESFATLILGFDKEDTAIKKKSDIDAVLLVKVYKEQKKLVLISIPANMRLYVDGNYQTITEVYRNKGMDFLCAKLTGISGLKINYHAAFGTSGITAALDQLGTVSFTVPVDMVYTPAGADKPEINIKAGKHNLNGQDMLDVMRFRTYQTSNGDIMKMNLQRSLFKEICKQKLVPSSLAKAPQVFGLMAKNTQTNFALSDLTRAIDLIFALPSFDIVELEFPVIYKDVDGTKVSDPNVDKAITRFQPYR